MVKEERKNNVLELFILALISLFFFFLGKDTGVFWDNVIFVGKMGTHLYENGIFSWDFPDSFDTGHPPMLAFILASGWLIFGKSLLVSHLLLFPFVFGVIYQIRKLSVYFFDGMYSWFTFLILLSEPNLCTQLCILNPEVLILFFFLLAFNSLLRNKNNLKVLALAFLGVTSFRGMFLCFGFFLIELFYLISTSKRKKEYLKLLFVHYAIASIPALSYILGNWYIKGWVYSHPNSPWIEFAQYVDFKGFFRNLVVLAHRYLDYGKWIVYVIIMFCILKYKRKIIMDRKLILLAGLAILSCIAIIIVSIGKTNPFGHRYFMVSYSGFILISIFFIVELFKKKVLWLSLILVSLVTGNLWIYPQQIAQGWDASLAHLPYYKLRSQAIQYLDDNNININKVTTFSPNATKIDYVDLNGDQREFLPFDNKSEYVMCSNVYNLTDEEIEQLETNYEVNQQFKGFRIEVNILRRK